MQTGPFIMCAGGMLQRDKQTTSHCLCAARNSAFAFRIPHSAFVPRTGLDLAASRSEQTDGRPWIERLGNAECGVRNAECCLQIEATGRCRQDRSLCARAGCSNTTSRRLHTAFVQLGIPHCAFRIPHSAFVPRTGLDLAASRSEQTDGRPWIERLGNAECGVRNAECCLQIEATGRCRRDRSLCARAGCSNTTSRRLHTAFVQLGIPHCAFRIPHSAFVPRTGLDLAASRSEQTDGRPWIERLGNAECGVRNAECCLQIEATGRCRRDRSLCARAGCSNTTSRRLHTAFGSSEFRIAHSAFRTPHSFPEQASTSRLHARSKRMVGRGSND